ncbi:MAG: STAS domain-containing protein [Butyrivibrio sp.]|nr:STAS domain-containing protein [Butyrivibrio sp.]
MTINKKADGTELTVSLEGRLDTTTAPELEAEMNSCIDGLTKLTFDMAALDYISSAGLRVLLSSQKAMNKNGSMIIKNANDDLMEIFEVTGFIDIFTIE